MWFVGSISAYIIVSYLIGHPTKHHTSLQGSTCSNRRLRRCPLFTWHSLRHVQPATGGLILAGRSPQLDTAFSPNTCGTTAAPRRVARQSAAQHSRVRRLRLQPGAAALEARLASAGRRVAHSLDGRHRPVLVGGRHPRQRAARHRRHPAPELLRHNTGVTRRTQSPAHLYRHDTGVTRRTVTCTPIPTRHWRHPPYTVTCTPTLTRHRRHPPYTVACTPTPTRHRGHSPYTVACTPTPTRHRRHSPSQHVILTEKKFNRLGCKKP